MFRYKPASAITLLIVLNSFSVKAQTDLKNIPVENGVSETLAAYRKTITSNIHYKLHFNIPSVKEQNVPATEYISFVLKENLLPLQLDFKEQKDHIKSIIVNQKKEAVNFENEHIIISTQYLKKGFNKVDIEFIAGDLSLNRNKDFMYSLFVPDRARTVFPCFDQPDLKAIFTLSLTIPKQWKAVENAPLKDSTVEDDNKTYNYQPSNLISTYLFSFVAGNFSRATQTVNGRTMNFYYRETDSNKLKLSIDTIFRMHANALNFLENYTGISFPFKKFDFIAIPDFQFGGMEHVGAILYKASTLFLDSGATRDQFDARATLIAHETSHMWFGDLVTMQWFNDVWTKEVFANFMADKITQAKKSPSSYALRFLIDHYPAAYAVDRTGGANPIRQTLDNLQDAGTLYGNIIYHKAPVMMLQLERLMGKDSLRNGLSEYLKKYKFSNATWPDLIAVLNKHTNEDLNTWNNVWVNEAGRPQISYSIEQQDSIITKFSINQKSELKPENILPQFFELALVYPDGLKEITINMNRQQVVVDSLKGKHVPGYILFNSSGQGYGVFPVDGNMLPRLASLPNRIMRAAAYINLYENMLNGNSITPKQLMNTCENLIGKEKESLNLRLITGYINDIFWRLILPSERDSIAPVLEKLLWQNWQKESDANKKKILFKTYQSIALTNQSKDTLYNIWKTQKAPKNLILAEDDYTTLATILVLKNYADTNILQQQLTRIQNPDRRNRLQFLMPALSADSAVRDTFFNSLSDEKNRQKEDWVAAALSYLHYPLRAQTSQKYLRKSLDLLQEIQLTGDLFFPGNWLQSTFSFYQTPEAASVVRTFLNEHPDYNPKLKAKILQAADPLFRAEKLVYGK